MRKYIMKIGLVFMILAISLQQMVSAAVFTTQKTEGLGNCVYVAGDPDMYPIEYYDSKTEEYRGVIPDLFKYISDRTGLDFVYINGNKTDKNSLGENLQVEIVSSSAGYESSYFKDYLELFSYTAGNEVHQTGLIFTGLADDEMISKIKMAASEISADKKNGIFLSYSDEKSGIGYGWLILAL